MSSEERRRSSRISELEARNAHQRSQKESKMIFDSEDEDSDHKRGKKKVKTRPLQDLISDPVDRQALNVEPRPKKLLSDAFKSVQRRTNATNPVDPRTTLPDQSKLELLLNILQRRDSKKIFAEPVDPASVKGYQDVVKHPMDFGTIGMKLSRGKYNSLEDFEHDVLLVFDNAMRFNQSTTVFYRQARAIRDVAEKLFHALRTDPTNFERHFFPASLRCGRWTKAEARLLNSTDQMLSRGTKGKRNEDSVEQRRQTYQPPGEEKLLASDVPMKTLIEAKEDMDYNGSLMRFTQDLGPVAKLVAMRNLSQNLPQVSEPQNEVSNLQTQALPYEVPNISQDSFHRGAAAKSFPQGSAHQNAVPALTDFTYRIPTKPPHLNSRAQSGNFYGGNVQSIGGMNQSQDPTFIFPEASDALAYPANQTGQGIQYMNKGLDIGNNSERNMTVGSQDFPTVIFPEASHTLAYPTHQTGQGIQDMNKGLDIGNNSERNMTVGTPYSSSFYKPTATTLSGNPNPFAAWNIASNSQGSNFSNMMQDAMKTDGLAKMGEVVPSYPGMQAIAAKGDSPPLPSWQEPSQVACSFPGNDYKDLGWRLQAAPIYEESPIRVGQRSNWLSPTEEGSSKGAGPLPHWLLPSNEGSSVGAGPVPNWLSLSHGGGSDQVFNCANPVTSEPQFFEFLCPQKSGLPEDDVVEQARIPQPQDQAPLHEARLGSVFDVQDAGNRDRKGKAVMESEAGIHHHSPSPNFPKWFFG